MNKDLKEKTNHGDYILPFTTYSGKICDEFSIIPLHYHEEIEITLNVNGQSTYNIDLKDFHSCDGDIYIIKPYSLHSIKKDEDFTSTWNTIVFKLDMLKSSQADGCLIKYLAPIINEEHILPVKITKEDTGYEDILKVVKQTFKCYKEKAPAFELELKSKLFHLFSLLYKNDLITKKQSIGKIPVNVTNKIKNILNYINENYRNHITVQDLAKITDFSEYHFMKFFKKYIGMTAIEYINNYRLEESAKLLKNTDRSIMDISLDVGFNNVSYFTKLFTKKYNVTPKKFRK